MPGVKRESEVYEFAAEVRVDQDVVGLDVSVNDPIGVQLLQAKEDGRQDVLDGVEWGFRSLLQVGKQVFSFDELQYKDELVVFLIKFDDLGGVLTIAELLEYLPFLSHQFLRRLIVLVEFGDLLGRVLSTVGFIADGENLHSLTLTLAKEPSPSNSMRLYSRSKLVRMACLTISSFWSAQKEQLSKKRMEDSAPFEMRSKYFPLAVLCHSTYRFYRSQYPLQAPPSASSK